jgi:hypothetical protein
MVRCKNGTRKNRKTGICEKIKLTKKEYISILEFYKKDISRSNKVNKFQAEKIIANKLCRCIKSTRFDEPKSIGICTRSIFNSKGLTRGDFNCTGRQTVEFRKQTRKEREQRD